MKNHSLAIGGCTPRKPNVGVQNELTSSACPKLAGHHVCVRKLKEALGGVSGSPHVAEIHVHERVACISQVFVHKYIYVQHDLARF